MGWISPGMSTFLSNVANLQVFPLFWGYIIMVLAGGLWQRNVQQLNMRAILVIYNCMCSMMSLYTLLGFCYGLSQASSLYSLQNMAIITPFFNMYRICKAVELLDTVFMILRHKSRQISFLHVYHHSSMLILAEYCYRHAPWPGVAFGLAINSFVHVLLYFYYGMTAWVPNQTLNWKKHLTEIQILQFVIDMVYMINGYLYHGYCIWGCLYGALMMYLFANFYYHAYIKKRKPRTDGNGVKVRTD